MKNASIYIHFPYCELKCPYCDFNSHVSGDMQEERHLQAYKRELDFFLSKYPNKVNIVSIFFGGGTPSLMHPSTVEEVIKYIKNHPQVSFESPEITLEANPASSEYKKFEGFKKAGINRLSIGVQSILPERLKFLGRKHSNEEAIDAMKMAKSLFDNYSVDAIYATQNQTIEEWQKELEQILQHAQNHISAYTLTIEKGTKFYKMHLDGKILLTQNEDAFYDATNNILKNYGFSRYEVSNYAKNNAECLHNIGYWQGRDYIGIGAGAHGRITINGTRFESYNFANPQKYLDSTILKGNALQKFSPLSKQDVLEEALIMNLRCTQGIDTQFFMEEYGVDVLNNINQKHLHNMVENGLIVLQNGILKIPEESLRIASSIAYKLI